MMKILVLSGLVILLALLKNGASGARLTDEYSIGTSLNKYLWSPKEGEDDVGKGNDGEKRTPNALWFGPRLGKRSQSDNDVPYDILDILEKVQKSPALQNILAEKLQMEGVIPYAIFVPNTKNQEHLIGPRPLRDSPDGSQNLNSRPYPPRFGRQSGGLPPYLPRLGRSAD